MNATKTRIHINLSVRDIEASKAFYGRLFGAEPSKVRQGYANWRLDAPALHLALVHNPATKPAAPHERHFGVELFDQAELSQWQSRLEAQGTELRLEEQVTCCYAVGNKFWATDPDGNEWEFWVRTGDAESMTENADSAEEGACCAPAEKALSSELAAAGAKPKAGACCAPQAVGATANAGSCC